MSTLTDGDLRLGALVPAAPGVWRLPSFADGGLVHGFGERTVTVETLLERLGARSAAVMRLGQVHGSAIAEMALPSRADRALLAGSDGAITDRSDVALTIRTADCAPVGFYDPAHHAIGAAHVGWRGLAAALPQRMVEAMQRRWGTQPAALRIVIGPAIGACCYEVGPEFVPRFPVWVRQEQGRRPASSEAKRPSAVAGNAERPAERRILAASELAGRRTLDLRAGIAAQLQAAGVHAGHVADSAVCTACHVARFHSYRREGDAAGRCHFALALAPPLPSGNG